MDKKFRSLLDELGDYAPVRDRDQIVESRAQQVIASAHNLIRLIKESYDSDTSDDLIRRLARSITSGDDTKFTRRIRSVTETRTRKATPL